MSYRIFALVQLFALVFYIIRPIMPHVEYALNSDFIAKNLCVNKDKPNNSCQGKCHLAKQVKAMSDTADSETNQPSKKVQHHDMNDFLNNSYLNLATFPQINTLLSYFINSTSTKQVIIVFVPPQG